MKDLVIIGAGGFGREVVALVRDINKAKEEWNFLGFIDDNETGQTIEGDKIIGTTDDLLNMEEKPYISIAIASAKIREKISEEFKSKGFEFATLIHPSVEIGPHVEIGEGSIICKKNQFTTNIKVGNFCILNENCATGHDTIFKDFVSVMSFGLFGGKTVIGKGCYFGLRCTIINNLEITDNCIFGAGSVVVKNVTESGTYVGVPVRRVK